MTKIKLNNVEVDKAELVKLKKEHPEYFEEEKPLGDDFSMLWYLEFLLGCVDYYSRNISQNIQTVDTVSKRLNALIKIWEWKEKNDGKFGVEEWMRRNAKYRVEYSLDTNEFILDHSIGFLINSELPYFSSEEITYRAIVELEQEYKIVFNVK